MFSALKFRFIFFQVNLEIFNSGTSPLILLWHVSLSSGTDATPPNPVFRIQWRTWRLHDIKSRSWNLENCNLSLLISYFDCSLFINILCALKKSSIVKLVNTPHKTSPYVYKTAQIFTTVTHNTTIDPLNQNMFCDLRRIASSPQTKNIVVSLYAATLPELLNIF